MSAVSSRSQKAGEPPFVVRATCVRTSGIAFANRWSSFSKRSSTTGPRNCGFRHPPHAIGGEFLESVLLTPSRAILVVCRHECLTVCAEVLASRVGRGLVRENRASIPNPLAPLAARRSPLRFNLPILQSEQLNSDSETTHRESLATTGGHADPTNGLKGDFRRDAEFVDGVVNGVDDARKAVRQRYKDGADLIKLTATGGVLNLADSGQNPQFTDEELRAIVATAKDYDMTVAVHAHGTEGMKRAVLAAVDSIEHGTFMTDEVMELMKERGTYLVPTISAGVWVEEMAKVEDRLGTLEAKKIADVVAVQGDPLEDITVTRNVVFVMKEGVVYKDGGLEVNHGEE